MSSALSYHRGDKVYVSSDTEDVSAVSAVPNLEKFAKDETVKLEIMKHPSKFEITYDDLESSGVGPDLNLQISINCTLRKGIVKQMLSKREEEPKLQSLLISADLRVG